MKMRGSSRSAEKHFGPTLWWVVSAVLLVVAVGSITLGRTVHHHPLAAPVPEPATRVTAPPATTTTQKVPVVAHSTPVSLRVPAIALSVDLSTLGLNPDGSVQVPDNDTEPGWFRLGPSPGQIGSAVILGHVDTYQGPGIFFQLRTLVAGDQLQVTLADGTTASFAVSSVVQYTKTLFPADLVYTSHGTSELNLVTCGGAFDSTTGHYLSNVVVYSSFVSATPPTTPPTTATPATVPPPLATGAAVTI
ncbi:MAG TPA: class F sortase [Acidimicrobiales bacterium]